MRSETPNRPLTPQEHLELDREIRAACARMHSLCDLVTGVYGPQNQTAFSFHKVTEALDRLAKDLEAQAARDRY